MSLPRILLFALIVAASIPWLSVELLNATTPGSKGEFREVSDSKRYFLNHSDHRYRAPETIGTTHDLRLPTTLVSSGESLHRYHSLGPTLGTPRPALVLLHGGGRDGRSMLDMWQDIAKRKNLILIAPDAARPVGWSLWHDGPLFTGALLKDAARHQPIDPDQIYLIGHSMGAKLALRMANLGFGPWRAVAIHAGQIPSFMILPARRDIPIFLHVGAQDPIFKPKAVRRTAQRLSDAGHDVTLTVVPDHTHWNYRIAPQLAPQIWAELQNLAPPRIASAN